MYNEKLLEHDIMNYQNWDLTWGLIVFDIMGKPNLIIVLLYIFLNSELSLSLQKS